LSTRESISDTGLVGREAELASLTSALDAACELGPCLVVLTGDAGVGKSRLAREIASRARTRGMITLQGDCVELSGGEIPYGPLAAAIRELDADVMAEVVEELPAAARRQLARAFPGLPFASDSMGLAGDELTQAELFGWLLLFLGGVSSSVPLLVTIEDVQWADASTRDFLLFLSQQMRSERLCVLATLRSNELSAEHPVRPMVERLASQRSRSAARVGSVVTSRCGAARARHPWGPASARSDAASV